MEQFVEASSKLNDFISTSTPKLYWYYHGKSKFPVLYEVAVIVFSIPTSAERVWSLYDFIHTKKRNRLSASNATKLVQLYMNADLEQHEANIVSIMMGLEDDGDGHDDFN